MKNFNPSSKQPDRAVQAWQILVCAAMNRETLTYRSLSMLMYGKNLGLIVVRVLRYIDAYCDEHKLPHLTALVLGSHVKRSHLTKEQVYQIDWFNIYPPTAEEMKITYDKQAVLRKWKERKDQ